MSIEGTVSRFGRFNESGSLIILFELRTNAVMAKNGGYPSVRVYSFTKDSGSLSLDTVETFNYEDPGLTLSQAFA